MRKTQRKDIFLDLHNVFFENYFANEITKSIVFESNLKHSQCVFYQT
jgi:hypothetical protein